MIGTSMLYCALWALWLSAAAWMIERVMLRGRGPVRAVWITAVVLSVVGPVLGYTLSRRVVAPAAPTSVVSVASQSIASIGTRAAVSHSAMQSRRWTARFAGVRDVAARADRPLGIAWIALSLGLLVYITGGLVHLRFVRRRWRASVVNGTQVMISDNSGPALVGVVRSTIVIPEWALGLEPDALALMLRHELEHQSAGDTRMLAFAETLLMLMPWSPMLWWQLRRLRLAIEIDCDARVLRALPDVGSYGRLLLEFGRQHREMHFAGAALAGHAAHLEERIRRMTRRPAIGRGKAAVASCIAGVVAIVVGCQLPVPTAPVAAAATAARVSDTATKAPLWLTDSTLVAAATKHDQLRVMFDSADAQRAREQTLNYDLLLSRVARDTARTRIELKIPEHAVGVPLLQQYFELRVAQEQLAELSKQLSQPGNTRALVDELSKLRDRLASTDLDAQVGRLQRMIESIPDYEFKPSQATGAASGDSLYFLSDSAAAVQNSPGCSAKGAPEGSGLLKLLVPDDAATRAGSIALTSAASSSGSGIEFAAGVSCYSQSGELRLYGRGAFDGAPIVVRTSTAIAVVVMTGSGRILAGPIAVQNDSRRYELTWSPR